ATSRSSEPPAATSLIVIVSTPRDTRTRAQSGASPIDDAFIGGAIDSYDVIRATPVEADLAWTTHDVSSCALSIDGQAPQPVSTSRTLVLTTQTESGLRSYALTCDGLTATRSIFWGVALSVQDFAGARAIVGDLIQQTSDFQTDYRDDELKLV